MVTDIANKNAKNEGKSLEEVINGRVLSLAMSGGKTVMESVLAPAFLEYALKKEMMKGIIIGKPTDLVDKALKEADSRWVPFDRETFRDRENKFEEGRITVMSYKDMFEAGLTYKDGTTKGKNPFKGYIVLADEIHELLLSVPMITSTKMSEVDILRDLGVAGRAQRVREKLAVDSFMRAGYELLKMRMSAIDENYQKLSPNDQINIRNQAIKDLSESFGGAAARLRGRFNFEISADGKKLLIVGSISENDVKELLNAKGVDLSIDKLKEYGIESIPGKEGFLKVNELSIKEGIRTESGDVSKALEAIWKKSLATKAEKGSHIANILREAF